MRNGNKAKIWFWLIAFQLFESNVNFTYDDDDAGEGKGWNKNMQKFVRLLKETELPEDRPFVRKSEHLH